MLANLSGQTESVLPRAARAAVAARRTRICRWAPPSAAQARPGHATSLTGGLYRCAPLGRICVKVLRDDRGGLDVQNAFQGRVVAASITAAGGQKRRVARRTSIINSLRELKGNLSKSARENSSGMIHSMPLTTTRCYQVEWAGNANDLRKLPGRRSGSRIGIPLSHDYHGCALPTEPGGHGSDLTCKGRVSRKSY